MTGKVIMGSSVNSQKKILIIYYSYSSQTKNLLQAIMNGMEPYPVSVSMQRIEPVVPQHFPFGSVSKTIWKMVLTFFRQRLAIQPLPESCFQHYDLIILAGPTWSYNPSGPVLALFDRDGKKLFKDQMVIPLISCRGYWRMHWWGLKALLKKCGATVPNLIVFSHPSKEPWRTLGVFLKLAGKVPERIPWMKKHYRKYGHTRDQLVEAERFGTQIAEVLVSGGDTGSIEFKTDPALYNKS
jgi:hypothetical protein